MTSRRKISMNVSFLHRLPWNRKQKKDVLCVVNQQVFSINCSSFQGMLPSAFAKRKLKMITKKPDRWFVFEKTDGERGFCVQFSLQDKEEKHWIVVFRDENILSLDAPEELGFVEPGRMQIETVLDAEITEEGIFVFDVLMLRQKPVVDLSFQERFLFLEEKHLPLRARKKEGCDFFQLRDFVSRCLDTTSTETGNVSTGTGNGGWFSVPLWKSKTTGVACDGLIFQDLDSPYEKGRSENVQKYKNPLFSTADFLVEVRHPGPSIFLHVMGDGCILEYRRLRTECLPSDTLDCLKTCHGKVVEFLFHPDGEWVPIKERSDRETPNFLYVVTDVLESIAAPVSLDTLFNV